MRKLAILTPLVLVLLAGPAPAITNGELDGDAHPNVGAIVVDFRGRGLELFCSGTLIDPRVFLTASHCTTYLEGRGISRVFVSFDAELEEPVDPGADLHPGTMHSHPDFSFSGPGGMADPHDIAVVVLDRPAEGIQPARLPSAGQLAEAARKHELKGERFTVVGYGVHEAVYGGGPPSFPFDGDRWRAIASFRSLHGSWLHLSQNPATGDGGACYGDSGGPNFLGAGAGETDVIAGITVTGDIQCRATNVAYRLDTPSARAFLDRFVALP